MTTERGAPAFWARGGRLTAQGSLGPGSAPGQAADSLPVNLAKARA